MADVVLARRQNRRAPLSVPTEYLEIHNRPERLELVAKIAQPLQSIIDVKKSRLTSHPIVSDPSVKMELEMAQIGEVFRTV